VDPHERQIELGDLDRCTYVDPESGSCARARSYALDHHGPYCPWHALPSRRAGFLDPDAPNYDAWIQEDFHEWRWWKYLSREGRALSMLTNEWDWQSSSEWCEAFGCCGRGWAPEEDEGAFGELRAAHLLAGLPLPDWTSNPGAYPPRRRSLEVAIDDLTARVHELEHPPARVHVPGVVVAAY
jgi:hypothetical protein